MQINQSVNGMAQLYRLSGQVDRGSSKSTWAASPLANAHTCPPSSLLELELPAKLEVDLWGSQANRYLGTSSTTRGLGTYLLLTT